MRTGRKRRLIGLVCAMALLATVVMPITTAGAVVVWEDKTSPVSPHEYGGMFAVNGKVLAIGGNDANGAVEEYDPASDTWTSKTSLNEEIDSFAAVELNGKVYIFGGYYAGDGYQFREYDIEADTWTTKTPMPSSHRHGPTAQVVNGKIYVIGGGSDTVDEYDPGTDTWTTKTPIPTSRSYTTSALVDGKIYVIGGGGLNDAAVEAYDPATDTWETKASLPVGMDQFGAVTVNGKIYALGGNQAANDVQKYDPQTDSWTIESPMHFENNSGQVATAIGNKIYTIGGNRTNEPPAFEVGTIPEVTGNTQATIGPAAELTLNPETLEFGNVSPTVGNYTQTRVASVKSNKNWELFVRKLSDLTGANTADVIPSSQLTFTSAAQGSPIEFNLAETLVNSGAPTAGTDSNVDYALNVGWEDQPDSYSAQHIYTVVQP